jgi:hypothetical protein
MLERLLEPRSIELPHCTCGQAMGLERTQAASRDTEIKIFRCPNCDHEFRLTVWIHAD